MNDSPSELLRTVRNPFAGGISGSPWDDPRLDVPEIHQEPYDQCLRLIEDVRQDRQSSSLLIFGDAGTGKTHLLGRVRRYIDAQPITSRPLFASIELATSPGMIWRHLRRRLAIDLLRPLPDGAPRLHRLLEERAQLIGQVADAGLGGVLELLRQGSHALAAEAWLRGDPLGEATLRRMDLPVSTSEEESLEDQAQRITLELCRLLEPVPIVLCLDQMESLKRFAGDDAGLRALGRAVTTLYNGTRNLAIVSCCQSVFIRDLETAITSADMDRLGGQNPRALRPLYYQEAERLVAGFLDLDPALAKLRNTRRDPLWPLEPGKLRQLFGQEDVCTARKVIYSCKGWFEESRGRQAEEELPVEQFLANRFQERLNHSLRLGPETGESILQNGIPLLLELLGCSVLPESNDSPKDVTLLFRDPAQVIALCICPETGNQLTNRLKRLAAEWAGRALPRLLLVRDSRLGISPSARVAQIKLRELQEAGAHLVDLTPEAIAALDATHFLASAAAAGNLIHRGESVPVTLAQRWLALNLPESIEEVKDIFRGKPQAPQSDCLPQLADLVRERRILNLEEAAALLQRTPEEVIGCARSHPSRFGLLGGREKVLFAVSTQAEEGVVA